MPQLTKSATNALIDNISEIYTRSRGQADAALKKLRNAAYWEIGRHIVKVEQANNLRAEYGEQLLQNISSVLTARHGNGFSVTNLQNMRQFYLAFPSIQQTSVKLPWSAYQLLSTVKDKKAREALARKAGRHDWSVRELKTAIRKQKIELQQTALPAPPQTPKPVHKLKAAPGIPYTYSLKFFPADLLDLPGDESRSGEYCVDLGFSAFQHNALQGLKRVEAGMIVELAGESLTESAAGPAALYTYRARLDRIVDGDTVKCAIDLGFDFYTSQKLRLRGIDCSELSTAKGQEVKAFVETALKGKPLIIKTHKTDKWDRYLVDIWYDDGQYLNQVLLDNGLAELYQE